MDAVERWFVRRGVPLAIFEYNASEDILTRMIPFLAGVWLFSTAGGFEVESRALSFLVLPAGLAILLGIAMTINRLRRRPLFARPDRVRGFELAVVVLTGPIVALLFGNARLSEASTNLLTTALVVVLGYAMTKFGVWAMIRWGVREVFVQLRGLIRLLGRSLPLMLLFATFLFLNAEMWQVANELTAPFFAIMIGMVLVPAVLFLVQRSPDEIAGLHDFSNWSQVDELCAATDAPLPSPPDRSSSDVLELVPLKRGERRNLASLMLVAQLVQVALVAAVIGAFFVVFGAFTVREETLLQWTAATAGDFDPLVRLSILGDEVVLTWELFAVSGFIAAISALQFAVSSMSDEVYREQFRSSLETEVREVLAVRARYLEPMTGNEAA